MSPPPENRSTLSTTTTSAPVSPKENGNHLAQQLQSMVEEMLKALDDAQQFMRRFRNCKSVDGLRKEFSEAELRTLAPYAYPPRPPHRMIELTLQDPPQKPPPVQEKMLAQLLKDPTRIECSWADTVWSPVDEILGTAIRLFLQAIQDERLVVPADMWRLEEIADGYQPPNALRPNHGVDPKTTALLAAQCPQHLKGKLGEPWTYVRDSIALVEFLVELAKQGYTPAESKQATAGGTQKTTMKLSQKDARRMRVQTRYRELAQEQDAAGNPAYPSQEKLIEKLTQELNVKRRTIMSDLKWLREKSLLPPSKVRKPKEVTNRMHRIDPTSSPPTPAQ